MPEINHNDEQTVRDRAYLIWEREGRPEGRAHDHWYRAIREEFHREPGSDEPMSEEEKVLAGRIDANMPALLTKDCTGRVNAGRPNSNGLCLWRIGCLLQRQPPLAGPDQGCSDPFIRLSQT